MQDDPAFEGTSLRADSSVPYWFDSGGLELLNALLGIAAAFSFTMVMLFMNSPSVFWFVALFCASMFGVNLASGAAQSRNALRMYSEAVRDKRAPFLILRSFRETRLQYAHQYSRGEGDFGSTTSLLEEIGRQLETEGQLIGIGGQHHFDAGKIPRHNPGILFLHPVHDRSWRDIFEIVASGCRGILIFPGLTTGLSEELDYILSGPLIEKSVVMQLPAWDLRDGAATYKARWERLREELRSRGKNLPAYQPSGYFYIPRADLSIDHGSAPSIFGHVGAIDLLPFEGKTSELSEIMLKCVSLINWPKQCLKHDPLIKQSLSGLIAGLPKPESL